MKRLMLLLLVWSCDTPEPPEEVLRPVRFVEVHSTAGELERTISGTTQPGDQSGVGFKVSGRLRTLNVEVGDQVVAGKVLAELDDTELRLQLQQAEASLAQASASYRASKSTYDRVSALFVNDNASASEVEAARAQMDANGAQTNAAARQRDLARRQLEDSKLVAAQEGAVAQVLASAGEVVGAGSPVVVLATGANLEVAIGVPGTLINRVSRGMPVVVTLPSLGDKPFGGKVTEVAVAGSGSTFPVTVVLDDETPDLRGGLAAEVAFVFPPMEGGSHLTVPLVAVGEAAEGRFVWVVDDGETGTGVIRKVAVEVGDLRDDGLEIKTGLEGGERVVTAGVSRLHEGQVVAMNEVTP
jgi:RND family efflux transporter MFP subunit